jgi:hypothetical protein
MDEMLSQQASLSTSLLLPFSIVSRVKTRTQHRSMVIQEDLSKVFEDANGFDFFQIVTDSTSADYDVVSGGINRHCHCETDMLFCAT